MLILMPMCMFTSVAFLRRLHDWPSLSLGTVLFLLSLFLRHLSFETGKILSTSKRSMCQGQILSKFIAKICMWKPHKCHDLICMYNTLEWRSLTDLIAIFILLLAYLYVIMFIYTLLEAGWNDYNEYGTLCTSLFIKMMVWVTHKVLCYSILVGGFRCTPIGFNPHTAYNTFHIKNNWDRGHWRWQNNFHRVAIWAISNTNWGRHERLCKWPVRSQWVFKG